MSFLESLHTSASGLGAQRLRMNLISSNLANAGTSRTPEGGPYRKKTLVLEAAPVRKPFGSVLASEMDRFNVGVRVAGVQEDPTSGQRKYDPQHPDADENGYVTLPNVNVVEEMVNMMAAIRSYEANVTAINAAKDMALKALEIGR